MQFSVLIREVVERRLNLYEQKEGRHAPVRPEYGLCGPGGTRELLEGFEPRDQGAAQAQRPLPDRDSLQRTAYDARYMDRVSSRERRLAEEDDELTEMRRSFEREELSQ